MGLQDLQEEEILRMNFNTLYNLTKVYHLVISILEFL